MKNIIKSELILEVANTVRNSKGFSKKVTYLKHGVKRTDINVSSEDIAIKIDREVGNYVCLDFDDLLFFDVAAKEYLTQKIVSAIKDILKRDKLCPEKIFIVGLGNENFACDSLGKKVASQILVTKPYLDKALFDKSKMKEIYSVSLGVYGTTGLESSETIKSMCQQICPDLVVVIDSLIASHSKTLSRSVQISDTKLSPGGGVGNCRKEISEKILGTKILAIGVPLVLNISDCCKNFEQLIVTLKDIETKVSSLSRIIANAINLSFTNLSQKDYLDLTT